MRRVLLPALLLGCLWPALAQAEERDLCADRPGLAYPTCTVEAGRVIASAGLIDWTRDRADGAETTSLSVGGVLVQVGVSDRGQLSVGWNAYNRVQARDRVSGAQDRVSGTGDVTLAYRHVLTDQDADVLGIALMPYATLPIGDDGIGAGTWSAGLIVPVSYELGGDIQLLLTGSIGAAANESGRGRHLQLGAVAGIYLPFRDDLGATAELAVTRDHDPAGRSTQWLAGLSAVWLPGPNLQVDLGANIGLNAAAPDVQLYGGVARRF